MFGFGSLLTGPGIISPMLLCTYRFYFIILFIFIGIVLLLILIVLSKERGYR